MAAVFMQLMIFFYFILFFYPRGALHTLLACATSDYCTQGGQLSSVCRSGPEVLSLALALSPNEHKEGADVRGEAGLC